MTSSAALAARFAEEATAQGLPVVYRPASGPLGFYDLPAISDPAGISRVGETDLGECGMDTIVRAVRLLDLQCRRAADEGLVFAPGTVTAQVRGTQVQVHGGVPLALVEALSRLVGPGFHSAGIHATGRIDVATDPADGSTADLRARLQPVIVVADRLGEALATAPVDEEQARREVNLTVPGDNGSHAAQFFLDSTPQSVLSAQLLADMVEMFLEIRDMIAPVQLNFVDNRVLEISAVGTGVDTEALVAAAGRAAERARQLPAWQDIHRLAREAAGDGPILEPLPELWATDTTLASARAELWAGWMTDQEPAGNEVERRVRMAVTRGALG